MVTKRSVLLNGRVLVLLVTFLLTITALGLAYNLNDYYPLAEGNSWTYSVIEDEEGYEETVKIDGKEIVNNIETKKMVYSENAYECANLDSEGLKIYKSFDEDEYEIFEPPMIILPNNMKIGETREYSINSLEYNLDGAKIGEKKEEGTETGRIKLEVIENVEVPAGKFTDCLKFSLISDEKKSDGSYERADCTVWFAPGIGKVKEFCINTEYEAGVKKETSVEIYNLISAVVDGKRIGRQ